MSEQQQSSEHESKGGLLSKVAAFVDEMVTGGALTGKDKDQPPPKSSSYSTTEHKTDFKVEVTRHQDIELRESELYRYILQQNEEDLVKAADKLDEAQALVRNEIDQVRFTVKENDQALRQATDQLQRSQDKMQNEVKMISDLLASNEETMNFVADKLEQSAKQLRSESDRIKAEELNNAAEELRIKTENLVISTDKSKEEDKTKLKQATNVESLTEYPPLTPLHLKQATDVQQSTFTSEQTKQTGQQLQGQVPQVSQGQGQSQGVSEYSQMAKQPSATTVTEHPERESDKQTQRSGGEPKYTVHETASTDTKKEQIKKQESNVPNI